MTKVYIVYKTTSLRAVLLAWYKFLFNESKIDFNKFLFCCQIGLLCKTTDDYSAREVLNNIEGGERDAEGDVTDVVRAVVTIQT